MLSKSDLESHVKKLIKNWFSKRGYPAEVISEQVNRALRSEENVIERDEQHMKANGVPLVVTYNPNFKNLSLLIIHENFCMLTQKLGKCLCQHLLSQSEVLGT